MCKHAKNSHVHSFSRAQKMYCVHVKLYFSGFVTEKINEKYPEKKNYLQMTELNTKCKALRTIYV